VSKMARREAKAYSEAFRNQAVKLADQPDRTATDVARELRSKRVQACAIALFGFS